MDDGADSLVERLASQVASLSEANATLTRILGAIEEYVYSGEFLADGDYVLRYAGPCRERFLGMSQEAARDARWVDHVHRDDIERFLSSHEDAKRDGALDIQYRLLGSDGRLRWVRDRGRMRRAGDRTYLDGSVLDVTALRETEQRLNEHVRDIEALAAAHQEMALTSDPAAGRRAVCRAVRAVCGASSVALLRPAGGDLAVVASDGLDLAALLGKLGAELGDLALPIDGSSRTAAAYRSGVRAFVSDAAGDPGLLQTFREAAGAASVLFEPVVRADRCLGVITIFWTSPLEALPARVLAMLPLLVTEVAIALERADLVDRLSAAAHTDALTGLLNRHALDDLLAVELLRATRTGLPLCLAMLDVDHFKAYNDRHGHPAGDLLLRQAGQRWGSILRGSDALVRFGGEEFLVLLPECDLPDAHELLESLRRATPFGQSCSIGVARWDGSEPAGDLLHRADQMMYAAKRAGRDRVLTAC